MVRAIITYIAATPLGLLFGFIGAKFIVGLGQEKSR
jgi:hypothetical protein